MGERTVAGTHQLACRSSSPARPWGVRLEMGSFSGCSEGGVKIGVEMTPSVLWSLSLRKEEKGSGKCEGVGRSSDCQVCGLTEGGWGLTPGF